MWRPFIHANFAADIEISGAREQQNGCVSISCDTDWNRVHVLRERYDAVAVGGQTWNTDRPRLTARQERLGREPLRQPSKVIFAGGHRCHVAETGTQVFLITSGNLECPGVTVIRSQRRDLAGPLCSLYQCGVRSMLVEGGPTILQSFFTQGLVDVVTVYVRSEDESAAREAARLMLGDLPSELKASRLGAGYLLQQICDGNPEFLASAVAAY